MAGLMAQDARQPARIAALHLVHQPALEARQARVGQIEGDGHPGHAVGAEPLLGEPEVGPAHEPPAGELLVEPAERGSQGTVLEQQPEVAEALVEQRLIIQPGPRQSPTLALAAALRHAPAFAVAAASLAGLIGHAACHGLGRTVADMECGFDAKPGRTASDDERHGTHPKLTVVLYQQLRFRPSKRL